MSTIPWLWPEVFLHALFVIAVLIVLSDTGCPRDQCVVEIQDFKNEVHIPGHGCDCNLAVALVLAGFLLLMVL